MNVCFLVIDDFTFLHFLIFHRQLIPAGKALWSVFFHTPKMLSQGKFGFIAPKKLLRLFTLGDKTPQGDLLLGSSSLPRLSLRLSLVELSHGPIIHEF